MLFKFMEGLLAMRDGFVGKIASEAIRTKSFFKEDNAFFGFIRVLINITS